MLAQHMCELRCADARIFPGKLAYIPCMVTWGHNAGFLDTNLADVQVPKESNVVVGLELVGLAGGKHGQEITQVCS